MFTRAVRAARFDKKAFTEAYFNDDAAADGAIIVASVGTISYLGILLWHVGLDAFNLGRLLQTVLAGVMSWLILAIATWFVATRLFGARGRPQTMMGLQGLAVLPLLLEMARNQVVAGIGLIWYLALLVMATREAGDLSPRNAGVAVLVGFALAVLVRALFSVPFAVFG